MSSIWEQKPELVEKLKELWTQGLSCSQIARALGNGLTRNACIGKVTRLGLNARGNQPRKPRSATLVKPRKKVTAAPIPKEAVNAMVAQPDPDLGIITMLNAATRHCRYPYGDPGDEHFHYCGRTRERGNYCEAHASICYVPLNPTKRVSDEDKKLVASLEVATGINRVFG